MSNPKSELVMTHHTQKWIPESAKIIDIPN